jgi:hypothetical protein
MKYRILFLVFIVFISFPVKTLICMGPAGCFNPLSSEYSYYGDSLPSFGFGGGAYRIHSQSAYVSSFWAKVNDCISYCSPHSFTLTSAYRCPYWNYHEGGAAGSIHLYGNAADHLTSEPGYWLSVWRAYQTFDYGRTYTDPERFHVDDGLK